MRGFVTGRHRVIWYGIVRRAEELARGPWHAEAYGVGRGKRRAEQRERGLMLDALRRNTTPRQGTGAAPHTHLDACAWRSLARLWLRRRRGCRVFLRKDVLEIGAGALKAERLEDRFRVLVLLPGVRTARLGRVHGKGCLRCW